jgi:membrane protein
LLVVVGTGFLLLASLVLSAVLAAFGNHLRNLWSGPSALNYILQPVADFVISIGVITLLFAMIFKVLPDAHIA